MYKEVILYHYFTVVLSEILKLCWSHVLAPSNIILFFFCTISYSYHKTVICKLSGFFFFFLPVIHSQLDRDLDHHMLWKLNIAIQEIYHDQSCILAYNCWYWGAQDQAIMSFYCIFTWWKESHGQDTEKKKLKLNSRINPIYNRD